MVRHESLLLLEPRRDRDVIGVEASNEWGPGEAKRPVERRSTPLVLLAVDDNPRIARSVLRQDLRARVRGPVVDHDQLEVREGLREHALDGFSQEPLAVVDGHYDRHARSQGPAPVRGGSVVTGALTRSSCGLRREREIIEEPARPAAPP